MQTLAYESSWNKAISKKDREEIEKIFRSLNTFHQFTVIRHAVNHKEELLVTTLVHNTSNLLLQFQDTRLAYYINGKQVAGNIFTLPSLSIPPGTSMPWTFIFPVSSWEGRLETLGELAFA